jgi:hypothetical protein
LLKHIPKVGPATALDFKVPNTKTEDMYIQSVNRTVDDYNSLLREDREHHLNLPDTDCDTGRDTAAAEYSLADKTYARLLHDLSRNNFAQMTPLLRKNILNFYSSPNALAQTRKNMKAKAWNQTEKELSDLKNWKEPQTQQSRKCSRVAADVCFPAPLAFLASGEWLC